VKCKISTMEEIYSTTGSQMYEKKTLQLVFWPNQNYMTLALD
jgi:hypothetical protein